MCEWEYIVKGSGIWRNPVNHRRLVSWRYSGFRQLEQVLNDSAVCTQGMVYGRWKWFLYGHFVLVSCLWKWSDLFEMVGESLSEVIFFTSSQRPSVGGLCVPHVMPVYEPGCRAGCRYRATASRFCYGLRDHWKTCRKLKLRSHFWTLTASCRSCHCLTAIAGFHSQLVTRREAGDTCS